MQPVSRGLLLRRTYRTDERTNVSLCGWLVNVSHRLDHVCFELRTIPRHVSQHHGYLPGSGSDGGGQEASGKQNPALLRVVVAEAC